MTKTKLIYYLTPSLLTILVFYSNFIKADLFQIGVQSYAVWFLISLFAFVCGWLMNKTLGYSYGGKIVFAVIIANVVIGLFMVSFFNEYFGFTERTTENMILYSLRIISIGSMAFFGMAVSEVILLQNSLLACESTKKNHMPVTDNSKHATLIVDEAKLKSEKMIYEAEKKYNEILNKKEKLETRLKELIASERELIKRYESSDFE
ncbi:MAG: hypothetical protein V1773_04985 [bacterium]